MSNEVIFANGMKAFKPNERAPDFVIADLVIDQRQFNDFMLANHVMGEVRVTIKQGQKGPYYAALNTWRPEPRTMDETPQRAPNAPSAPRQAPPPPAFPPNDALPGLEPGDAPIRQEEF